MIRPFYFADEIFYWARIGNRPTVLEFQCVLAGEAEPQALREALLKALQVHTNFRARPVVSRGQFYSKIEDVENPPLYEEDGRKRRLGTDETEGLLLYATYKGRVLSLHVFHGLSDFRGINAFLNTILKFYFSSLGLADVELPEPDSADTIPCFEDILERGAPGDTIGYFVPKEEDVFHIPEKNFGKWTTMQHICEIDVPLEPLLALSRSSESTIVPTIHAFIGRAIRNTYDVGDKVIIGYTPVDLRPIFHFETSGNASSNFPIPYSKKMDSYSLKERAMLLRTLLDVQIQPENLYERVRSTWERSVPFIGKPLPAGFKTKVVVREGRKTDTASYTYGISYAGKVRFGDEIDPLVTSLTACAGSYSYPLWILACEFGGILRMVFTQAYESDTLVRNICREIASEIPGTTFSDWGHHEFDEFYLRHIEHLLVRPSENLKKETES